MTDNLIGDRYVLGPLLGRGGMAEVRRARDIRLERDVAIKRLKADLAGDPIFQERFRREAHSAAGLNHPNIVSVFDTGESFDEASGLMIPYIVMELVVGHTLREILHDGRKIQPVKALDITQSILDALDYSHRHGIIHRDIKPANVMLTSTGQVKVMDFGIARAVSDTAASMTQTASVIGTPQYLSPEQIRGESVDRRSDLYSAGCLLYELLTGKPPFEGDSPVSLAYQHVKATPVPPSEIDPLVSSQMDTVVLKALAKNPTVRYQSAHEMREDIARLLAGQKVLAVAPPPVVDTPTEVMTPAEKTQVLPTRVAATTGPRAPSRAIEPVEEDEPNRLGRIIGIVVGAMLIVALIAAGIIWAMNGRGPDNPINTSSGMASVPYVETMKEEQAIMALEDRGLKAKVERYEGEDDDTVGTVTAQNPANGTSVATGSTVTIRVNSGPKKIAMPDVKGKTYDEAVTQLKALGFTTITKQDATPAEAGNAAAGTVVLSAPAAAQMTTVDTEIVLKVATGTIAMPDVTGLSPTDAVAKLQEAGFTQVTRTSVVMDEAHKVGTFTVTPGAGQSVSKDTPITIAVAELMPNVQGYEQNEAIALLSKCGLAVPQTVPVQSTSPIGSVTESTPAPNEVVTAETPINLAISQGMPAPDPVPTDPTDTQTS